MEYSENPLDTKELSELLISRGLICDNICDLYFMLEHIGYYRLSGYFKYFQEDDRFINGTTLNDVCNIYKFDRKLRLLVLEALEKIEIFFRSQLNNYYSPKYGIVWYLDEKLYKKDYSREIIEKIRMEIFNNKENDEIIKHFYNKYSSPEYPPSWMVFEILSFGQLSKIYKNLVDRDFVKIIVKRLSIPYPVIVSWLHSLTYLRNLSAHHRRIWNRIFVVTPKVKNITLDGIDSPKDNRMFYTFAFIIIFLLRKISDRSNWEYKLGNLIKKYNPKLEDMGYRI